MNNCSQIKSTHLSNNDLSVQRSRDSSRDLEKYHFYFSASNRIMSLQLYILRVFQPVHVYCKKNVNNDTFILHAQFYHHRITA